MFLLQHSKDFAMVIGVLVIILGLLRSVAVSSVICQPALCSKGKNQLGFCQLTLPTSCIVGGFQEYLLQSPQSTETGVFQDHRCSHACSFPLPGPQTSHSCVNSHASASSHSVGLGGSPTRVARSGFGVTIATYVMGAMLSVECRLVVCGLSLYATSFQLNRRGCLEQAKAPFVWEISSGLPLGEGLVPAWSKAERVCHWHGQPLSRA